MSGRHLQLAASSDVQWFDENLLHHARHLLHGQLLVHFADRDVPEWLHEWPVPRRPVRDRHLHHTACCDLHGDRAQGLRLARRLQRGGLQLRDAGHHLRERVHEWTMPGRPLSGRHLQHASCRHLRERHHPTHLCPDGRLRRRHLQLPSDRHLVHVWLQFQYSPVQPRPLRFRHVHDRAGDFLQPCGHGASGVLGPWNLFGRLLQLLLRRHHVRLAAGGDLRHAHDVEDLRRLGDLCVRRV